MPKESVLVTGGAGFIGSHVTDCLVARGYRVVVLDDLSGGARKNVNPKALFVRGSVLDRRRLEGLFKRHRFGTVFHLAAYAAEGLSHFIRRFNYENNLIGSINLINLSVNHKVRRFVFTSSIAVYGANQVPMREDMVPLPEDPYGIAKLAVEADLKAAEHLFGLEYVIFRPHNVYGERQNMGDRYRNVIGIFLNQILSNKPLSIFGDGHQKRAFTYVGDIAPLIADAGWNARARNQVFNIGSDDVYSVKELARIVLKMMDKPDHPIRYLKARKEVKIAFSDHSKVKRLLGRSRPTGFEEGMRRMCAWARGEGRQKLSRFGAIEIPRNLPEGWLKRSK